VSEPFFKFKCDVDGKFAAVRLYRGRIDWQPARVSSTARILILGVPAVLVLGVAFGLLAAWAFRSTFHGVWDVVFGAVIGLVVGLVFGYRLGILLGDVIFPTKNREVQSVSIDARTSITARNAGRIYSFIRVENRGESAELRIGPKYADLIGSKLRSARTS
jgi:hypothetical protein